MQDYIHRVGRTARGLGTAGRALLFLRPEELGFLDYLKQSKVTLNEYECYWDKAFDVQAEVGTLLYLRYWVTRLTCLMCLHFRTEIFFSHVELDKTNL